MIRDLLFYFVIYNLSFFSIYTYGKYFRFYFFKENINSVHSNNEYVNLFFGFAFFIVFSWFYHFLFGFKNEWMNLFIILVGNVIFLLDKKQIKEKSFYFLPSVLFLGIIIYNNHNDFHLYHFQNILEFNNEPKIGIGNLNPKYVYASMFVYFESLFNLPKSQYHFINIPRYLVFVAIVGYLYSNINNNNNNPNKFLSCILLIFILLKFKRFSEHGYDYIAIFFTIFIFLEYFYKKVDKVYNLKNIIFFFSILISLKVIGLFFSPFIFYAISKNYLINSRFNYFFKNLMPSFIVFTIFLSNSFINSGCIFYPIKSTCFSSKTISWSVNYDEVFQESDVAKKWAKGFYHQNKNKRINNYEEYSKNLKWISSWFKSHFLKKILEPILIFISILLIFYFLSRSNIYKKKDEGSILILSSLSLIFWLFGLPQLRFGYFYVLLFVFLIFSQFLKKEIKINNQSKIFILLAFVFFNLHNLNRVYKEYKQNSNFPWYQTLTYKTISLEVNNIKYFKYFYDSQKNKVLDDVNDNKFIYNLSFNDKKLIFTKKYNFILIQQSN